MTADQFISLAEGLTGTPVKDVTATVRSLLDQLLADETKAIGHSQLNELLLLVNKDRMERAFFDYFFGDSCTVGSMAIGVLKFQKLAMLCFGNFIHAYRTLSHASSRATLEADLGEWARSSEDLLNFYAGRSPKLVDVQLIPRQETPLVGCLSASEIVAEDERCQFLQGKLREAGDLTTADWSTYETLVAAAPVVEREPLQAIGELPEAA